MALYKQSEFAKLCGISKANLSTYKKRGKVQITEDLIDDSLPVNADFLTKMLSKKGKLPSEITNNTDENAKTTGSEDAVVNAKREKATNTGNSDAEGGSLHNLERQKKKLDIQKTAEEIELLRKKNEKMEGELIPTGLVQDLLRLHFLSATNQFRNSIENILTAWAKKKDFTREEIAEIRGFMLNELNKSIQLSVKESQQGLGKIIEEFTVKKSVGERA